MCWSGCCGLPGGASGDNVSRLHTENHLISRIGWLRAAVLGANDGIVSTASLIVGVAAANAAATDVLVAGVAGLVAGAMSMAAGEYVSVSSNPTPSKLTLTASEPNWQRSLLSSAMSLRRSMWRVA
jgi:hypothetical protein